MKLFDVHTCPSGLAYRNGHFLFSFLVVYFHFWILLGHFVVIETLIIENATMVLMHFL